MAGPFLDRRLGGFVVFADLSNVLFIEARALCFLLGCGRAGSRLKRVLGVLEELPRFASIYSFRDAVVFLSRPWNARCYVN